MAVLAVVALASAVFGGFAIGEDVEITEQHEERAALAIAEPARIIRPDTEGFVLSILCDTDASDFFVTDEGAPTALSERVEKRNAHLTAETGAYITRILVPSVYDAAWTNSLSGMNEYSLYAADAAEGLSPLLSAGLLRDVSGSQYIRTADAWFDGTVMESLSLYGGQYLISSTVADARQNTAVLLYDRTLYERSRTEEHERTLTAVALDGEWTFEQFLVASRGAERAESTALLAGNALPELSVSLAEEEVFHGFSYGEEDIFPLYVAAGGSFCEGEIVSLPVLKNGLATLMPLTEDASSVENPDAFAEGATLFTVATLAEAATLRESGIDVGILPLPKPSEDADYRAYIDPRGAAMLALPRDDSDAEKVEYLIYRMAFLSAGYVEPYFAERIAGDDPDTRSVLTLISESTVCDLAGLLGYGEIETLVAETVLSGNDRLTMDYYNRKTLYEKALSILEKRLIKD